MKIAVLGAGSWGTALAHVLSSNGYDTVLWARRQALCDEVNRNHTNQRYLPNARLPESLYATSDLPTAVSGRDIVIFAVPSSAMVQVVNEAKSLLASATVVAHAVKGFEVESKRRISQVLEDIVPDVHERLAVITGPSHAEEVVYNMPTTIVVAAFKQATAEALQDVLMNSHFRVYTNPDVVGAELGGSLKNIIALGVGLADGLGFGDNAKAALMTRGLAEIARLGMKLGASPLTFAGLSGVGDLIVTCTSEHSRNFRTGRLLGKGFALEAALSEVGMAVEGVRSVRPTVELAAENGVEMPITQALYDVLFKGKTPQDAVEDLMGRERGHEVEEVARMPEPKWK